MHNIICAILFPHKDAVNPASAAENSNHRQQGKQSTPTGLILIPQEAHRAEFHCALEYKSRAICRASTSHSRTAAKLWSLTFLYQI